MCVVSNTVQRQLSQTFNCHAQRVAGVVVAIAGFPGKSIGECLFGVTTALLGVALGGLNFVILSKLRESLVAQAIVFVIMMYILGLMKVADPRYDHFRQDRSSGCLHVLRLFAFSLLAILMTFNGVDSSTRALPSLS